MKTYFIIFALILSPIFVFGATLIVKEYKSYDFFASVQTFDGSNVYLYKVDDPSDPNVKCYVMTNSYSLNQRSNGASLALSCLKVK